MPSFGAGDLVRVVSKDGFNGVEGMVVGAAGKRTPSFDRDVAVRLMSVRGTLDTFHFQPDELTLISAVDRLGRIAP